MVNLVVSFMKTNLLSYIKKHVIKLEGNALVCVAFHPLWGIPYSFYFFYLSLYMKEHGVTDSQLGFLTLAGLIASILFSFIAAPIVDSLGRKKATFIFDLISSALPPLIYAISGSFWFSLVATILNNTNKIMSVAYYLVMIEDASDEQRITAFNLFNLITIAAGTLIPVAGFFVGRFGLVQTEKFFLVFSFISMTSLIIARNHFLKETGTGKIILEEKRKKNLKGSKNYKQKVYDLFQTYSNSIKYLKGNPLALIIVFVNIIFYIYYYIGTNNSLYFSPYLTDALGLGSLDASVVGSAYAASMLFAMLIINPILKKVNIYKSLIMGGCINIAGLILLVTIPARNLPYAIVSVVTTAIGFGIFKSFIDAALAIASSGESGAGIYSIVNLFSALLGSGAAALASVFYPVNPRFIYIMSIILLVLSVIAISAILTLLRKGKPEKADGKWAEDGLESISSEQGGYYA